mgnify:CR=1 FL=1
MEKDESSSKPLVDENILNFIYEAVDSYAAWDIITYLSMGREKKVATIEEISDSIGRDKNDLVPILDNFVEKGYVSQSQRMGKKFFSISQEKEKERKIHDFVKFSSTREGRLKIIYIITKHRMEH